MHLDNLLFILLIAMAILFRLLARKTGDVSKPTKPTQKSIPAQRIPEPARRGPAESDEERIRRFLEALGQPTGSRPPPPVLPRTNIPPRPLAPIQPPPIPTARNLFTGRKRLVVDARKSSAEPVFEVYETAAPVEAPQPPAPPPATAYAVATRPDLAGREAKVDMETLLRSRSGLRNAIVLREIFGPPRSLQSSDLVQSLGLL